MNNILVIKLSAIGDVIHAIPAIHALKEYRPSAHISWVVEPAARDIVAMCSDVDEIIVFPKKELKTRQGFLRHFIPFRRLLQKHHYDVSMDLQGLFKSAAIAFFVRAHQKIGTGFMREGASLISRPIRGAHMDGHIVEQNLDVVRALGCPADKAVFPFCISAQDVQSAEKKRLAVCGQNTRYAPLIVGASRANKRWPTTFFARLADQLRGRGIMPILVGGGADDVRRAEEIQQAANAPVASLVEQTSLPELAALFRGAAVVIGGDTGPTHLSDALDVPTLMMMGSWPPTRNGLYRQPENVIEIERSCRRCMKRICPLGLDCLADITPDRVMERVENILAKVPAMREEWDGGRM